MKIFHQIFTISERILHVVFVYVLVWHRVSRDFIRKSQDMHQILNSNHYSNCDLFKLFRHYVLLKTNDTILKKFHESSKIELEVSNTKIFLKRQYLFFLTKFYKVLSSLNFQALINKV